MEAVLRRHSVWPTCTVDDLGTDLPAEPVATVCVYRLNFTFHSTTVRAWPRVRTYTRTYVYFYACMHVRVRIRIRTRIRTCTCACACTPRFLCPRCVRTHFASQSCVGTGAVSDLAMRHAHPVQPTSGTAEPKPLLRAGVATSAGRTVGLAAGRRHSRLRTSSWTARWRGSGRRRRGHRVTAGRRVSACSQSALGHDAAHKPHTQAGTASKHVARMD